MLKIKKKNKDIWRRLEEADGYDFFELWLQARKVTSTFGKRAPSFK